jgi:cell division topological specificity factor
MTLFWLCGMARYDFPEDAVSFLSGLFGGNRRDDRSAKVAKERLLTVLVHDRVKLTPQSLEELRAELADVIKRYVPTVNPDEIEVTLLRGDERDPSDRLKADVPLRRALD